MMTKKKEVRMREKLTAGDVKKIQEEIEYRKLVVRKRELEAVKEARAHGDLSENFEYKAAKQDKNRNESRIRYLEKLLKQGVLISEDSKEDEVGLNKKVTLLFVEEQEEEEIRLVTSIRGNSLKGWISIESPIGKSILGKKEGEIVEVILGEETIHIEIKKIEKVMDTIEEIRKY